AFPPMPSLATPTLTVAPFARSRRARSSGQRLLPLVVDPRPSVIESPNVISVPPGVEMNALRFMIKYQCSVVTGDAKLAAETTLPVLMYEVVRDPGWPVTLPDWLAK